MFRINSYKVAAISLLTLTLVGCGGGGGSTVSTPAPDPTPAPTPTTPPTPTPDPAVADFVINEQNKTLVRYAPGNTINYDIRYRNFGNAFSEPFTLHGSQDVEFTTSISPVTFDGGIESMTKKITSDMHNIDDQRPISINRDEYEEIIQFPVGWSDESGTSAWVFSEVKRRVMYSSASPEQGILLLPGDPHIGYSNSASYQKLKYLTMNPADGNQIRNAEETIVINHIDVVETPLGTFDAYRLEHSYIDADENGFAFTNIGMYWIHPAIGVIKARFTRFDAFADSTSEYVLMINDTNLPY